MKIKPLEDIKALCQDVLKDTDVTVKKVEFKNGDNPTITVFIDKVGGVDLDTCEMVSKLIDAPIDELDPTLGANYCLNVSSLGIDRAFETDGDFYDNIGQKVEVKLKNSVQGKKKFDGVLMAYDGKTMGIKTDKKSSFTFDVKNIVKVNKYIEF